MNKKTSSTAVTLLIAVAIIAVLNYIVGGLGFLNFRADLTDKKLFTLSDGTRRVISALDKDEPVTIKFYATRDSRLLPQFALNFATTVEDLLLEFEKAGNGKITLEKIDPRPDTEEEDKAVADDIQGHVVNQEGNKAYFGLAIESFGKKEVIPVLNPNDESSLEYQIARTLAKVTKSKSTVVGVMSSMPVAAPPNNLPPMLQQKQTPPAWVVVQQLRQDYEVKEVPPNGQPIDADVNILIVVHPAAFSEKAEFAVDQFLLRGGKVVAFVDPQCMVTQAYNPNQGGMGMMAPGFIETFSDMKNLFKAWGVGYDPEKIVADMAYRTNAQGRPQPTFLTIDREGINRDEPVTSSLEVIQMFSAGAFTTEPKEGITVTPLIHTSENSDLIDRDTAEKSRREALTNFQGSGKKRILALRLSGKFKTAFPAGPPADAAPASGGPKLPGETGGEDKVDAGAPLLAQNTTPAPAPAAPGAAPAPAAPAAPAKPASLLESQNNEGVVFLFADADMEYDMFALESDPSGRIVPVARNSNIPLLLNTVEMLSGGADLIGVRSRAVTKRPFLKMEELRAQVESEFRPLIEQRTQELNGIVQKIADLGGLKQEKGMVVLNLNQEQRRELVEKQSGIQKDIRDLQKAQNRKKDRMEMIITALNVFAVPAFIIIFGIILSTRRRLTQAAR